jgi:signal transduction histidine kinase
MDEIRDSFVYEFVVILMNLWEASPLLTISMVWSWLLLASAMWVGWIHAFLWLSYAEFGPWNNRPFSFLKFKLPVIFMRLIWWPVSLLYYGRDTRKWLNVQFGQ